MARRHFRVENPGVVIDTKLSPEGLEHLMAQRRRGGVIHSEKSKARRRVSGKRALRREEY